MSVNPKSLKKVLFFLVLLGFIFPMKAPVSSAKAKLCCMTTGHCMMGKAEGGKVSVMGQSTSAKMISCCQDNCVSYSDTSILHSRTKISSQNIEMPPVSASIIFNVGNNSFLNTGPPNSRPSKFLFTGGIHSPPIYQLNSIFLI